MKLGILSESHGCVQRTCTACELLFDRGAGHLCHCGDIGSEQVLMEMAALLTEGSGVSAVLGNVDLGDDAIQSFPASTGVRVLGRFGELELDGKRIALVHGDDPYALFSAIRSGQYDYVLTGHTHEREDRREGRTRVINPGAIHRAHLHTVAILDLKTDALEFLPLHF